MRRLAGNMYQLPLYPQKDDKDIAGANNLTIVIRDANLHDLQCQLVPDYDLEPADGLGKTKLDIDLLQFSGDKTKPVIVTVEIENEFIEFMPDEEDENSPGDINRLAVTAGKQSGLYDLRNLHPPLEIRSDPLKTISFVVYRTMMGNKKPHPFNIGLIVKDKGYEMPVILDPKVRNDGG